MRLIYTLLPDNIGAAVILNGVTVYHEDDDEGYSQAFTALNVAERLAESLQLQVEEINLTWEDISQNDWNFDDVQDVACKKAGVTLKSDYQLLRQAVTDYARNQGFRNAESFPDTLIRHRQHASPTN